MARALQPHVARRGGLDYERLLLLAALLLGWWFAAPSAVAQDNGDDAAEEGVTLRWRDRLGERMLESTQRELDLTVAFEDGQGERHEQTSRQSSQRLASLTTLAIDEQRERATRAELRVREAQEATEENDNAVGEPQVEHAVLHDAEAIRAVHVRNGFPWPVAPVRIGQSWRIRAELAQQRYGAEGTFDDIELRFTLLAVRRDAESGRRIAQIVRHLERSGTGAEGTIRETGGRALLEFDLDLGRAVRLSERIDVEVESGEAVARGRRSVERRYSYETVRLIQVAPRAEPGTTQTERSETRAEFMLAARDLREPERQAGITRRIENVQAIERTARETDEDGRPRRVEATVVLSRGYTASESPEGELLEQARQRGPLEGLSMELVLDREQGTRRLASRQRVRRQLERLLGERAAEAGEEEPSAQQIEQRLQEVEASLEGVDGPIAAVQLPRYPLPVGFVWRVPPEAAQAAAEALFAEFDVEAAGATVQIQEVRRFGGRENTAVLLTELHARGTLAGSLQVALELPALTFFDLDEQRPLASRGEGKITLEGREAQVRIEGAGALIATTIYHYSEGPNLHSADDATLEALADSPLLGRWVYLPEGSGNEADERRVLVFERTGRCRFVRPHLETREPVERVGTWRIEVDEAGQPRVIIHLGPRDRDTFAFEVHSEDNNHGDLLTLTKVKDSRQNTDIPPWLPQTSAHYRRSAE